MELNHSHYTCQTQRWNCLLLFWKPFQRRLINLRRVQGTNNVPQTKPTLHSIGRHCSIPAPCRYSVCNIIFSAIYVGAGVSFVGLCLVKNLTPSQPNFSSRLPPAMGRRQLRDRRHWESWLRSRHSSSYPWIRTACKNLEMRQSVLCS